MHEPDPRFQSTVAWAVAYLRGRATAYARGSVTIKNVDGAAKLALSRGASVEEVRLVLRNYLLEWDEQRQSVVTQ